MTVLSESPLVIVALLTPFSAAGDIDIASLRDHLEFLSEEGVDGVMVCGTTGEGPLLEDDEVTSLTTHAREVSNGRFRLVTQVGRPGTDQTMRLSRMAMAGGAEILSVVTPYYYKLEDSQLLSHYRSIIRTAADIPVFAYSFPQRTGNHLSSEVVRLLVQEGLSGIKDSTKSFERHLEYLDVREGVKDALGFAVFMGSDSMVLDSLKNRSNGCVSSLANVRPELFVALREAVSRQEIQEAGLIQDEILRLRSQMSGPASIRNLKLALAGRLTQRGGHYSSVVRAPLA